MCKDFRNKKCIVVAASAFESMQVMEWGSQDENQIIFCITRSSPIYHPQYFRGKKSDMYNHFKTKEKRGTLMVTHSDYCTFTMLKDSSVIKVVDNSL